MRDLVWDTMGLIKEIDWWDVAHVMIVSKMRRVLIKRRCL